MKICPNCGWENRVGTLFCEHCGIQLVSGRASSSYPVETVVRPGDRDTDPHPTPPPARQRPVPTR
ncbi:MAG: zinc ribbon domain-containing protein [Anaerolineae bacterium]|nr:zinc ribbon domain-containing protein [Anaerolineae bacterium]